MSEKTVKRPSAKAYAKIVTAYKKQINELQTEIISERCRRETAQAEEIKVRQQLKEANDWKDSAIDTYTKSLRDTREAEQVVMAMLKQIYLPAPHPVQPGTIIASWQRTEKGDANNE